GDAVLKELARRLHDAASRIGTVCRYGGEEFAVLVPKANSTIGTKVGELVRQTVARAPFDLRPHGVGLTVNLTISVGVAAFEPGDASADLTPERLVHAADQGVYAAKRDGRNCVRRVEHASHALAPPRPAGLT